MNKQVTGLLCILEIAFTFALCFTVLHTTLPPAQLPNRYYGIIDSIWLGF